MSVRAKLLIGALILVGATVYVAFLGATSSWQYYLTVDECSADISRFTGRKVRVSGNVAPHSLQISGERTSATFVLQGASNALTTSYRGPLPDNFAEGVPVVVEGSVEDGGLRAEKVLTRCASKYESPPEPMASATNRQQ
jgi:cytochrome c-type biogenesis protein CcmE